MTMLQEQTSTQIAAAFLRRCPPHDTARSPGTAEPYHETAKDEHGEFKLNSLMYQTLLTSRATLIQLRRRYPTQTGYLPEP